MAKIKVIILANQECFLITVRLRAKVDQLQLLFVHLTGTRPLVKGYVRESGTGLFYSFVEHLSEDCRMLFYTHMH